MATDKRMRAQAARTLQADDAFQAFVAEVRDEQMRIFANSGVEEIDLREDAHAIIRALNQIDIRLEAAIGVEKMLDRKEKR